MNNSPRTDGMDISAFFGVLRRRALIIVVAVLAAAGGAYLISKTQTSKYTASAKLLLTGGASNSANPNTPLFVPSNPSTASDREDLVTRQSVKLETKRRLAKRIGQAEAAKAVAGLTASSGQDSSVVKLTAVAGRPEVAALAANTLANTNIAIRKAATIRGANKAASNAQAELRRQGAATAQNAGLVAQLQQQIANYRTIASTADGSAQVVAPAAVPGSPSSPKPGRAALIGAFGGLLLGLALALIREQMDRRVRGSKDLEEAFGLPVLASVPKSRAIAHENGQALEPLPAREAEAFQMLRANLRYLNTDKVLRSVVVTSTGVGDGKSTVSLNLAKAEAMVGKKVLLVEADIRRPRLSTVLGLGTTEGLTAFLSGRAATLAEVTNRVPVGQARNGSGGAHTLDVVLSGPVPDNPSGLMDSERMRALLKEAEANYDLVVLDTPPATMVADPIALMSEASAVVVVGRVGRITSSEADELRDQLERIDAPAYGLVANFAPSTAGYGYGDYT